MKIPLLCSGLLLLSAGSFFAQPARIRVDAFRTENRITPWLYGACTENVNHEIDGGLYDQKIFGESFEEPSTATAPSVPNTGAARGRWAS